MNYVPGLKDVRVVWFHQHDGEHDTWIQAQVQKGKRIGPRRVAYGLKISRQEAKALLERAAERGVLKAVGGGWYRSV